MPPAKRQLLDELVQELGLDMSNSSSVDNPSLPMATLDLDMISNPATNKNSPVPTTPSMDLDLDMICNKAYDAMDTDAIMKELNLIPSTPPQPPKDISNFKMFVPVPKTKPMPSLPYPIACMKKEFPLTINESKGFQIGIDVDTFVPYFLLRGDANKQGNRAYIRLTKDEFNILVSHQLYVHFKEALRSQTKIGKFELGTVTMSTYIDTKYENKSTVNVDKNGTRISLAGSSWFMVFRTSKLMKQYTQMLEETCEQAKQHWASLISKAKDFCLFHGIKSSDALQSAKLQTIYDAYSSYQNAFPDFLKEEMMIYKVHFLRSKLAEII